MLRTALHVYSSVDQLELQARLLKLVVDSHGWILEDKLVSDTEYRLRFEVGLPDIADVYEAFHQAGLHCTPASHRALTEMCVCQKHLPPGNEAHIVSIDLHVVTVAQESNRLQRLIRLSSA